MRQYRKPQDDTGFACSMGCLAVTATIILNLLILAAVVWVVATIIKSVFNL